jgi:DNA-binding Lrp family transcriptional regulator
MKGFDEQERKILTQLIRNPRLSDNAIARAAKIPVTTVNRKRKALEAKGHINYLAYVRPPDEESRARQLYVIKFKLGITRQDYLEKAKASKGFRAANARYHAESFMGEKDGHFALIIIVEARNDAELVEIFNGEIIAGIKKRHGDDCIADISTVKVNLPPLRIHHNYLPLINVQNGRIREDWPDEWVHVPS